MRIVVGARALLVGSLALGLTLLGAAVLPAQCPPSSSQYGSGSLAGCPAAAVTFTTCAFAGEYSLANGIEAGYSYTFTGTGGTGNYLTILDNATLTPVGFGSSPVTVTAPTSGTYRVQVNVSAPPACGTDSSCHTLAGVCNGLVGPGLSLVKTVGTTPGVCATTSTITVNPGTTVYYCYTATNTGTETLTTHTLVDDQLGTIFSGLAYSLAPGASIDTVAAGLSIPAVINTTTTNVGTWTGNTAAGAPAEATATATVNAVAMPDIDVSPLTLAASLYANLQTGQTLTIGNVGQADLNWEVVESSARPATTPAVPPVVGPAKQYPVVTSAADCPLYVNYAGREPQGWAEHCGTAVPRPSAGVPDAPTSTGFAQDIGYISDNFVSFALNNFTGQTVVGTSTNAYYGMDFDPTATILWALNDTTDTLGTIDLATGTYTAVVACPPGGGAANWTGLTIDPVSGVFWASTATDLFTIDPATGASALVGPFGAGGTMIDIAINSLGQMYGHDITTDSIYSINTATGAATLIGATGFAANYAQGMDFDNEDGTLYIFLYIGSGANVYGTVNLTTGAVTALATSSPQGEFEGATQTVGLCIPTDAPWLSASPTSGTTAPAGTSPVTVTFDSTGLAPGTYEAQLCVLSDDPDAGPGNGTAIVPVPVSLEVLAGQPAISVTKTVGTESGVCAATSAITVPPGTTVYYCYTVTNGGDVAFDLHTLVDDQLGTIFSGLGYALAPGASVSTVAAGLSIPAVMNTTTTNVATWTASVTGGPSAQATATATVTVLDLQSVLEIPTLSPAGLAGLVAMLVLAAFWLLRARRRVA